MRRLIDVDVLIAKMNEYHYDTCNPDMRRAEHIVKAHLTELIESQPTAYDLDKVVEQLERDSYEETADDMNAFEPPQVVNLYDAIEIVRGGGISKEEKDEDLER